MNQFSKLQLNFKRQLFDKVNNIEKLWVSYNKTNPGNITTNRPSVILSELHSLVHSITESSNTYGAQALGSISDKLEKILDNILKGILVTTVNKKYPSNEVIELIQLLREVSDNWKPTNFSHIPQFQSTEIINESNVNSKLIYLAEDDDVFAAEIIIQIERAGYMIKYFRTLYDLEQECIKLKPIAVIMNTIIANVEILESEFVKRLNKQLKNSIPIIYISTRYDISMRLSVARAGAYRFLSKPLNIKKLIYSLDDLTVSQENSPYTVLIVDDDKESLSYYKEILNNANIIVITEYRPLECLNLLTQSKPDVIVLDVYMPDCSGPELAQVIRQDDRWALTPIMFLSSESDLERQLEAMKLDGDDFLVKPVQSSYLISAIRVRARRARLTKKLNNDLESALRESDFQVTTMNTHNIVSATDVYGKIIDVNDNFCKVSGYSRKELIGSNHRIVNSGFHSKSYFDDLWETISSGDVWHGILCNRRKDGTEYWVDSTIVPFLDINGKPYKYVSARTNITALRESEHRLVQSQEFANIAMWDWNIVTGEFYWSDLMWPLFGYNKYDTNSTYFNFFKTIHSDDNKKITDAINNCIENGTNYNIEHRVVWPDGSVHWLHQSGNVIRCDDGKPLHMLGVVQDITINKHSKLKLQDSEERNRLLLESVGEGIFEIDLSGYATFVNPKFTEILGYTLDDLTEYPIHSVIQRTYSDGVIYPQEKSPIYNSLRKGLISKNNNEVFWHKNGNEIPIEYISTPVKINNKIISVVTIFQDISQRINIKEKLIEAKDQAVKANVAKSEFLASMSHELRTPMNAIIGFSQLLTMEQDNTLDESQKENVDEIVKAAKHLLDLINEVLDLAKIESGQIQLSIENVNLNEILFESLQLIKPLASRRGINIDVYVDGNKITHDAMLDVHYLIKADAVRLKQVLLNLLSNAVKYNCENGEISILFEHYSGFIKVSIKDSGQGLTSEQIKKLFTPFERLDATYSDIEGAGIGLVITKNIIEKMNGSIGVESEPGTGTTFWIEFPGTVTDRELNISMDEDSLVEIENPIASNKYNILYIEDNPANLRLVAQILTRIPNVHMWSAPEPVLGLELAYEHKPDLILLDINLPGLSGYEVLKLLRNSKVTCNTPVIAVSANAMATDIEKGLAYGFNYYITKPIEVSVLIETINSILGDIEMKA